MAQRFNSEVLTLSGNGNTTILTATTDTIISSIVLRYRSTESVEIMLQKSGGPQVSILLAGGNGELLDAPLAIENGDILSVTVGSYVRDLYLLTSYAYESPSYAGESIAVHNDVTLSTPTNGQVLTYNSTSGDWENADPTGGSGGGSVASYLHTQSTSSASWVVTHNLNNSQPIISVFDNANTQIVPENITINSANQLTVTFSTAIQGFVRVAGGSISGDSFDNIVFASTADDLPAAITGVRTLAAGVTYFITDHIDLAGDRLVGSANTTIIGGSSENCSLTSTGLGTGVALFTTAWTTPIRHITFKDVDTAIDISGATNAPVALDWTGVNFLNVPNVGTIDTCDNFIYSKGALLNSQGLVFDGTVGTIGIDNSIFVGDGSAGSLIEIAPTATVTRRFRTIYCSVVAFALTTGIDVDALATIPVEGFILDTVNFSGGGTYLPDVDHTSNSSRFENCKGVTNTSVNGQMYMQGNSTVTTISATSTFYKVAGTTSASADNAKFTHTSNRLTCDATVPRKFMLTAHLSFTAGNNQDVEFGFYDSTLGAVRTPSRTVTTTDGAGAAQNVGFSCVTTMEDADYVEIHCANNTSTTNVTVTNMNVLITEV